MRSGKETSLALQSASASEGFQWADELFVRARRAALRARMRAVTDRLAVRLAACALFVGALAGMVWWAAGLLSHL